MRSEFLVFYEFIDHVHSNFRLVGRDHMAGVEHSHEGKVLKGFNCATISIQSV